MIVTELVVSSRGEERVIDEKRNLKEVFGIDFEDFGMKIPNLRDKFNLDSFADLEKSIGMTKRRSEMNLQGPVKTKVKKHVNPKCQISASNPHLCQVFLPPYVPAPSQKPASFNIYKIQSINYKPKKYYKDTKINYSKTIKSSAVKPSYQNPAISDIFYHLQNFDIYKLSKAEFCGLPEPDL